MWREEGGTEAPAGKGKGVGLRPHASKGKDPKGKGRGVGPSPDASTGKGCKGAKDGKGGAEAPRLHGGPRAVRSRRALL